jgi:hypothetical protein
MDKQQPDCARGRCMFCNVEGTERYLRKDLCEPCHELLAKFRALGDPKPDCALEPAEVSQPAITRADDLTLHILRNPYGWSQDDARAARLAAADRIDALERTLEEVRHWFESERKSISKGNGSQWCMWQCEEQMERIDAVLGSGRMRDEVAKGTGARSQNGVDGQ